MQNEPIEVTLKVTDIFEKLGVPYLIGGSLASTLYGMVRTTQDSDIVAEMRLEHLQPFVSSLQDEFYIDEEMVAESIQRNSSFNIIHRETMFKVDVFIPRPRPFLQAQLAGRKGKPFLSKRRGVRNLPVLKIQFSQNSRRRTRPGLPAQMGSRAQRQRPAGTCSEGSSLTPIPCLLHPIQNLMPYARKWQDPGEAIVKPKRGGWEIE